MTVSSAFPHIGPHTGPQAGAATRANASAPLERAHSGDPSFADHLRDADRGAAQRGKANRPGDAAATQADAAAQRFEARVAIGDDAVRFDGRSLVAPTAEPWQASRPAAAAPSSPADPRAEAGATAQSADAVVEAGANGAPDSGPQGHGEPGMTLAEAGLPPLSPAPSRSPSFRQGPLPVVASRRSADRAPQPTSHHGIVADAAPRTAARAVASRNPVPVVTILPDEVVVAVPGLTLTEAERERIVQQARELVSGSPAADRPIRIVTPSKSV